MSTATVPAPVSPVLAPGAGKLRPRFEGTNIGTWIGFKHINYLVEEAVLEHLRSAGTPAGALYADSGVGFEIVDLDTRIIGALHIDDVVDFEVQPVGGAADGELTVRVKLFASRADGPAKVASSRVGVVLRRDENAAPTASVPEALQPFVVAQLGGAVSRTSVPAEADVLRQLTEGRNAYAHTWRIPYYVCHYTERLQMSGYLRVMEDVVDRFLAARGLSIREMLTTRDWIPACTRSHIRITDEALMEEDLHVVFNVTDIFKDFTYTASVECYVVRDGRLVQTANGTVTHGYAKIENRTDWGLVPFDGRVHQALRDGARR
ncbi:thioesterase family protein [Micromonospora tarensis]|uniref:Thioesterase family protein n=1 Tax=Micromonospora tarensis TaxID=2806100 RepID=A0ABS1YLH1_9ACTN|nr:thioesterase family protein [Micromonospora tarensis]MBM0278024.1 thioesterase family protein [Micromonospora tarensis]